MKLVLCAAVALYLGACGSKEAKAPPATSTDCTEAFETSDNLRMKEEHASPEAIQQLRDQRAASAAADIRSCTLNNTHAWAECVKAAKSYAETTKCQATGPAR